jgi:uncharacterized protein involved in exopolysaccharide biosynthesis
MTMAGRVADRADVEPEDGFPALVEAQEEERSQEPVLRELARVLRTYRRPYLAAIAAVTGIALVIALLLPPRYRATGSLMAAGNGMPQGLLARVARLTSIMPARDVLAAETLCSILRSRRISDPILDRTFERWPGDESPMPLKSILSRTQPGKEPPRDKLYRKLNRATRFQMDPETRIVTLSVETRYPHLSAQVANAYLESLSRYATEEHQSKSRLEARYIGQRIDEVRSEIAVEEGRLHAFYSANQNYATSTDPDIRIEQLRLERSLELRSRVMLELVSQQEAALLEERNQASLIQVIDRGAAPQLRSWPQRKLLVGGAFAGAVLLGFALMLVADHLGVRSPRDVLALTR